MLTAKNLERVMELEEKLRSEYQSQLDAKSRTATTMTLMLRSMTNLTKTWSR